ANETGHGVAAHAADLVDRRLRAPAHLGPPVLHSELADGAVLRELVPQRLTPVLELGLAAGHEHLEERRDRVLREHRHADRRIHEQLHGSVDWVLLLGHESLPSSRRPLPPSLRRRSPSTAPPASTTRQIQSTHAPQRTYGVWPVVVVTLPVVTALWK